MITIIFEDGIDSISLVSASPRSPLSQANSFLPAGVVPYWPLMATGARAGLLVYGEPSARPSDRSPKLWPQ